MNVFAPTVSSCLGPNPLGVLLALQASSGTGCGKLVVVQRNRVGEITMNTNLEVLEAEALKLAPADRSHLLERLIASLDVDPVVEEAWELEADRREASLESGAAVEVSGPEAMNRLRSKLAR